MLISTHEPSKHKRPYYHPILGYSIGISAASPRSLALLSLGVFGGRLAYDFSVAPTLRALYLVPIERGKEVYVA